MNPLIYQDLKPLITESLSLTRDAVHIHVGFFALLAALLLTKKKLYQPSILLYPFVLSFMMEVLDAWGDLSLGRFPNFPAGIHDLINTNLIPVCLYFYGKWTQRQSLRVSQ